MNKISFHELCKQGVASIVWREGRKALVTVDFVPVIVKIARDESFKVGKQVYTLA